MRQILTYAATLVIFLAIDAVYLGLYAFGQYRAALGDALLEGFRAPPAVLFYLLHIAGLMIFVMPRALAAESWTVALGYGALFGLFTYATYDLTNYATLRAWTLRLTVTDMVWGAFVTGAAAALGYLAGGALLRMLRPEG